MIYSAEHDPPHIHAIRGRVLVVFNLNCPDGSVEIRDSRRATRREKAFLMEFANANLAVFCEEWRRLSDNRKGA